MPGGKIKTDLMSLSQIIGRIH